MLLAVVGPGVAEACSCGRVSLWTHFSESDAVFVGRVERIEYAVEGAGGKAGHFNTQLFLKGWSPDRTLAVWTNEGPDSCGVRFYRDESWLVSASRGPDGRLGTNSCSPSMPFSAVGVLAALLLGSALV